MMGLNFITWTLTGLLLTLFSLSEGGKLLVVPLDGSHWLSMRPVVDELQQRGHEIVLVVPEINIHIATSRHYTVKTYSVPYTKEFLQSDFKSMGYFIFKEESFLEKAATMYWRIQNLTNMMVSSCQRFLEDRPLIRYLEEVQFDALLVDPAFPCGLIVAEHLSIPSVVFMHSIPCALNHEAAKCQSPSSYVPRRYTGLTHKMLFFEPMKNLLVTLPEMWLCTLLFPQFEHLASQFLRKEITAQQLYGRGSIWLVRTDFVSNYPRPVMPNMVFIGGINCVGKMALTQVCDVFLCPTKLIRTGFWNLASLFIASSTEQIESFQLNQPVIL